jgi:hypothetical protein
MSRPRRLFCCAEELADKASAAASTADAPKQDFELVIVAAHAFPL